jgi:hypothetical protein
MSENGSPEPIEDVAKVSWEGDSDRALTALDTDALGPVGAPQVTFRGNTYDLVALGSVVTGALILFSCLTCNMGYYCLPFISIALGAVGVLGARQSVEADRTKLWSWLGIAAGGIFFLLIVLGILLYVGLIIFAITAEESGWAGF